MTDDYLHGVVSVMMSLLGLWAWWYRRRLNRTRASSGGGDTFEESIEALGQMLTAERAAQARAERVRQIELESAAVRTAVSAFDWQGAFDERGQLAMVGILRGLEATYNLKARSWLLLEASHPTQALTVEPVVLLQHIGGNDNRSIAVRFCGVHQDYTEMYDIGTNEPVRYPSGPPEAIFMQVGPHVPIHLDGVFGATMVSYSPSTEPRLQPTLPAPEPAVAADRRRGFELE